MDERGNLDEIAASEMTKKEELLRRAMADKDLAIDKAVKEIQE